MAVFFSVLIEENIYGDNENVTIEESNAPLNEIVNSLGQEKYIINSINIWSLNPDQIRQTLIINKSDPDGNSISVTKSPQLDSFQKQFQIQNYKINNVEFDQNTKFIYEILPNTEIRFTINIDDTTRRYLSSSSQLLQSLGITPNPFIYGNTDEKEFIEPEEVKYPEIIEPSAFKEKEEKQLEDPKLFTQERKQLIKDLENLLDSPIVNEKTKPIIENEIKNIYKIVNETKALKTPKTDKKAASKLSKNIKAAKSISKKMSKKDKLVRKLTKKQEVSLLIGIATAGFLFAYVCSKT